MASTIPLISQVSTSISTPATSPNRMVDYGAGILSPNTPLGKLVSPVDQPSASSDALVVSRNLPAKLVEKIWRKEYVEMEQFLPAKLGATEPTLGDLVAGTRKPKDKRAINSIQEWVVCFNSYMAIRLMKEPCKFKDLLAYSSLIVKASLDYEGEAWLSYDKFFRRQAAAEPVRYQCWGEIDPSIWTQHFGRAVARPSCEDCGSRDHDGCHRSQDSGRQKRADNRHRPYPPPRRPPICMNWNRGGMLFQDMLLPACVF